MSFLSDLLRRFGSKQTQPSQPTTQVRNDLGFGSSGSTTAMLPPPPPAPPEPLMSVAPPKPMISVAPPPVQPKKPSLIKRLAKSVAPDSYENIKAGVNSPTATGSLKAGAKLAINLPKELVVQPAARFATQLGQEVVTGGQAKTWTPQSKLAQTLLGKEEVKPISEETGDLVRTGYELSKQYNAGRLDPNDPTSKFLAGSMTPFFALAAGGIKALDVEPGVGSGGKKAAKKLLKEGSEKLAKETLEKAGKEVTEQAVKQTAEELSTKAPKLVEALASKADGTVKPALREVYQMEKPWAGIEGDVFTRVQDPVTRKTRVVRVDELEKQGMKIVPRPESELPQKVVTPQPGLPRIAEPLSGVRPQQLQELPASKISMVESAGTPDTRTLPQEFSQSHGQVSDELSSAYPKSVAQKSSMHQRIEGSSLAPEQKAAAHEFVDSVENGAQAVSNKGKPITFEEVRKAADSSQKVIAEQVTRDQSLARQVELLKTTAAELEKFKNGKFDIEATELLLRRQSVLTDTARLLNSAKIQPTEKNALAELIKALADEKRTVDDLLKRARDKKYIDLQSSDPLERQAAQLRFYEDNLRTGISKWINLVRYNSMLSSPVTQARSLLGNLTGLVYSPVTKVVSGGVDAVRDAIFGGGRKQFANEAGSFIKGALTKKDSYRQAWSNFADAMVPSRNFEKKLLEGEALPMTKSGTVARGAENVLAFPTRLLDGVDRFIATLNASGEEASLISRLAQGGRLDTKGSSAAQEAQKAAYYWADRGKSLPEGQGVLLNFFDHATGPIRAWKHSPSPTLRLIGEMTVPFLSIAQNGLKKGIEFSPAGALTTFGAANKEQQIAKAIIGTSGYVGLAAAIASDKITGGPPHSKQERDAWEDAGIQPYSIKIGGRWISYQNLPAQMSYSLAFLANSKQLREEGLLSEDGFSNLMKAFAKQAKFFTDQSFMEGVGNFVKVFTDDDPEKYGRLVSSYAQQFIPFRATSSWLTHVTDEYIREPNTDEDFFKKQWQYLEKQFPIINKNVPIKINQTTGEPVRRPTWVDSTPQRVGESLLPGPMSVEDPIKAKQIRDAAEAKQKYSDLAEEDKRISADRKRRSLELYNELKNLGPDERASRAELLQKEDPELYKRLVDVINNVKARSNADMAELKKLNVNTNSRFEAVWRNLERLETKEEKNGYVKELYDAKVIDNKILQQIIERASQQQTAPQP